MNEKSCVGCKFLYGQGSGYSNYTWMETEIRCTKGNNPNLPAEKPSDWLDIAKDSAKDSGFTRPYDSSEQWAHENCIDNWPVTNQSRCDAYATGAYIELDVDNTNYPSDFSEDWEQIAAVSEHSGRPINNAVAEALRALGVWPKW